MPTELSCMIYIHPALIIYFLSLVTALKKKKKIFIPLESIVIIRTDFV